MAGGIHGARRGAFPRLAGALLAFSLSASASADTLYLLVDGVQGDAPATQPLGKGAFQLLTFTFSVDDASDSAPPGPTTDPAKLTDPHFDMPVTGAAVPLFALAAQRKVIPKASFVAVDDSGKARYRVDFEQVVIRTLGLQTLGSRDAVSGTLGYQRIRFRYGDGKDAPTSGWDRATNSAWK